MKVFWFDTETSGLNPSKHGIIQIAGIIEIDGEEVEQVALYSNCATKQIDSKALEVNGYTLKQIADFPSESALYHHLHALFSRYIDPYDKTDKLVAGGYNVSFDLQFLRQLWYENNDKFFGSFFAFGTLDPSSIFRYLQWLGIITDYDYSLRLTDIATYFGISTDNAHDALADIIMTRKIMNNLTTLLKEIPHA